MLSIFELRKSKKCGGRKNFSFCQTDHFILHPRTLIRLIHQNAHNNVVAHCNHSPACCSVCSVCSVCCIYGVTPPPWETTWAWWCPTAGTWIAARTFGFFTNVHLWLRIRLLLQRSNLRRTTKNETVVYKKSTEKNELPVWWSNWKLTFSKMPMRSGLYFEFKKNKFRGQVCSSMKERTPNERRLRCWTCGNCFNGPSRRLTMVEYRLVQWSRCRR